MEPDWPNTPEERWRFVYETENLLSTHDTSHRILTYHQGYELLQQQTPEK